MGREEQAEEREVLDSIFPDEIISVSDTEFRISVTLDIPDDESPDPPAVMLCVQYPDKYPDEPPILDLASPQNAAPHPLFNVSEDKDQLLATLEETVQENLGMAMVFTLVSALKEAAEQLVIDRREAAERVREEAALAAEREENAKFHGQAVTAESFARWREGFLKEMEEQRLREEEERLAELKKARAKEDTVRLTGRQLWERGLVGKVDEDADDDAAPTVELDKLKVSS